VVLIFDMKNRWAAKEAAIKAHTRYRLTWHDITILEGKRENGKSTAPIMTIKAKDGKLGQLEEQVAKISISHDSEYATAVCLVAEEVEDGITGVPTPELSSTVTDVETHADKDFTG
jgi:holo-[acyl-carrier protein] synthase